MSVKSVQQAISQAMKTQGPRESRRLTGAEASRILKEAEKDGVTRAEGKLLGKFYDKGVLPNAVHTLAINEIPSDAYYVDPKTQKKFDSFFVKHNLPFGGATNGSQVTPARAQKILTTFRGLATRGLVRWRNGEPPVGVRLVTVPLFRERHPDGFAYKALIPVGVVYPGAPAADPNKVNEFYVQRTGGFAGMTQHAGPFKI